MVAEIINFPIGHARNWLQVRPRVYDVALERSGSKEIAERVTDKVEHTFYACVPEKFQMASGAKKEEVSEFYDYIHQVVGSFIYELTIILTDGFILAMNDN